MNLQFVFNTFMLVVGIISLVLTIMFFSYLFKFLRNSKMARGEKRIIKKNLSEILKTARIDNRMTQDFVAETIGVSRQTIYKWEKGLSEPNMSNLIELAKLYNINIEELLSNLNDKVSEK